MQITPQQFTDYAKGDVRPHSWGLRMSFDKTFDDTTTFFTLDTSQLDGVDLLGPSDDNPIQAWDYYKYLDFSDRLTYVGWSRTLEFPYSVVSARADFELSNTDGYFTPHSTSPIASYILPKRPVRILSGFKNMLISQFVGLTQGMPEVEVPAKTATFTALDFLTQIYDSKIRETASMQDVRTDEILVAIFTQFGLAPTQYDLAKGRNTVRFLFFEKDQQTVGDIIRPLMQAEGGLLWLSEDGIIKFRPRIGQPDTSTYEFNDSDVVGLSVKNDDQIINHVIINTRVREVQEYQTVYSKSKTDTKLNVIPASGSGVFQADLTDPVLTVTAPTFGENSGVSWFTASKPDGSLVSSGVTVTTTEIKTNTYDITFANSNAFAVNINQLYLWGQPAKEISVEPIVYENTDLDSVAKYELKPITIDNNFVQDTDMAKSLALTILNEYSEYADILEVEVRGNPAIQLADIVTINYKQYTGQYRVIGITNELRDSKYTQVLTCRKYTPRHWFTLDQSQLDGTDQLAP